MPLNRSFLFAPGNVARRVEKALTLPADVVIVDLEDSVAVQEKERTRALVARVGGDRGVDRRADDVEAAAGWVLVDAELEVVDVGRQVGSAARW